MLGKKWEIIVDGTKSLLPELQQRHDDHDGGVEAGAQQVAALAAGRGTAIHVATAVK